MSRDLLAGSLRGELGFGRAESPPNWITANLEQLTSEQHQPFSQSSLLPGFNSLGLGGRNGHNMGQGGQLGGWGGSTATPPPGFSQHRATQLRQHYPGFRQNKNSEAQKIGGKNLKNTLESYRPVTYLSYLSKTPKLVVFTIVIKN